MTRTDAPRRLAPIVVVYAHPYPSRSAANRALIKGIRGAEGVAVRSLYELYPEFDIDVEAEQEALTAADVIVWQHPFYWYSAPALMKLWFEKVLSMGWAYGKGGTALVGKKCLWVTTTGAPEESYAPDGIHGHPFDAFVPVMLQTARFCGMEWLEPIVLKGVHRLSKDELKAHGRRYCSRLAQLHAALPREDAAAHAPTIDEGAPADA